MLGFWDILFPKRCVGCKKWGSYVCEKCEVGLWEAEQICPECNKVSNDGLTHLWCMNQKSMDGLISLWTDEGLARKIIWESRNKGYYDEFYDLLGWGEQIIRSNEFKEFKSFLNKDPLVLPASTYSKMENKWGFCMAELMAQCVAKKYSLKWKKGSVSKEDKTQRPVKEVLIVDGVWTNGSTLRECAKELKLNGTERVWGLVLAKK